MLYIRATLWATLALAGVLHAEVTPLEPAKPGAAIDVDNLFIPGTSAVALPMAEWDVVQQAAGEQTGRRVLILEGLEAVKSRAPAGASSYTARAYKFPQGAVRVLTFNKDAGPVIHQITFETELVMLQGSAEVTVRGEQVLLEAGDAVFLPSGVLRNMQPKEDTVVLQYFVASTAEKPAAAFVRGKDLKESTIVQHQAGDRWVTARTPEEIAKAPASAATYTVQRYPFDGNSIRRAKLHKGGRTGPGTYSVDVLIYISKGRMIRHEGDQVFEVVAGDVVREAKDQTGYWEILEDSEFFATDAPFDARRLRASP